MLFHKTNKTKSQNLESLRRQSLGLPFSSGHCHLYEAEPTTCIALPPSAGVNLKSRAELWLIA